MRKSIEKELQAPISRKATPKAIYGQAAGKTLMSPRDRMWAAMIKLHNKAGGFSPSEVQELAEPVEFDTVCSYLNALTKAKLAEKVSGQGRRNDGDMTATRWRLLVNWSQAPRVNKLGKVVTQGLGVLAMWRVARIRRTFTPSVMAREASAGQITVKLSTARQYCLALVRSGHFDFVSKGKGGIESVFKLVNDTGPHAPAVTRAKVVFDRNEGELKPIESAQEVCDALD